MKIQTDKKVKIRLLKKKKMGSELLECKRWEVAFLFSLLCIISLESKWVPAVKGECRDSREEGTGTHSHEILLEEGAF